MNYTASPFTHFPAEVVIKMNRRLSVVNARIYEILTTDLYNNWKEYQLLIQERDCLKENL